VKGRWRTLQFLAYHMLNQLFVIIFFSLCKTLMSVKLVRGYSSVLSLLHICVFAVALSSSLLVLNWRVLSFESTCDFHIFFLVPLHDFHVLYVCKRERKIVCVCLLSSICTIALARSYAQCVHIRFIVEKTTNRERERKKRCKKTSRIFVDFLFSLFFFFEINFVVVIFLW
jgi:hypothetical protein